jgi:hypothetical protein
MEDLFDASVRATKVNGKSFTPKEEKDTATSCLQSGGIGLAPKDPRSQG